jgi:hypothetical protein
VNQLAVEVSVRGSLTLAKVDELYHAFLQVATAQRAAFLKQAWHDEELWHEVESLLSHQKSAENFIEASAFEVAAGLWPTINQ